MRELFLVPEESSATSLVLRTGDGDQFFLDISAPGTLADATRDRITALSAVSDAPEEPAAAAEPEVSGSPDAPEEPETSAPDASDESALARSLPTPDPLLTAPLTMRPREIQGRIRAGATVTELAEEMGVAHSRVEPFAHPVLLERARMAELAKQSHPLREDGPAKLTLWEVLAAAFAARGNTVTDTEWDSYREADGTWVARVSWTAGLSENEAEWSIHDHATSRPTAEARNAVAADLTDPDFVQPVRTLTSVGRGERVTEPITPDTGETPDTVRSTTEELDGDDLHAGADEGVAKEAPTRRRRKAVTPHWEDVLLGVRTNTKRPRN